MQEIDMTPVDLSDLPEISQMFFKQYKPENGDLIAVKRPRKVSGEQFAMILRRLSDDIVIYLKKNAIVVGVESFSDIKRIDDDEMERLGWVRKSRVLAFKDEPFGKAEDRVTEHEFEEVSKRLAELGIGPDPDAENAFLGLSIDPEKIGEEE